MKKAEKQKSAKLKKIALAIFLILAIFAVLLLLRGNEDSWICDNGQWVRHGHPSAPMPGEPCGQSSAGPIAEKPVNNFDDCAAAYPVMESYPRQCKAPDGKTFSEDIGNELKKQDLVRISSPRPNEIMKSPIKIRGEARGKWYFEASFPVKLLGAGGNLLGSGIAQAQSDWMTDDFVPFEAEVYFKYPGAGKGTLILEKDNPSGLPENADELRIPVSFAEQSETMAVKAYFINNNLDPEISCDKVFPAERNIAKTEGMARAALEELLKGPLTTEQNEGYYTSINPGVKILGLSVKNGTARADFDSRLDSQVAGSCRVSAIRAQIKETLKQFPTVKDVVISVGGRTEDILQP